ncbi:MAG: RNA polymerase sigma factor [Christensenellales bacterium]
MLVNTTEKIRDRNDKIENLLSCIAEGDSKSMGLLYDIIGTDVFAYALSKTGNKQDADDVMQDTFVQVYKYAKQYKPQGKPMAWIIRIELNLIRRQYRLNSRTTGFDEDIETASSEKPVDENVTDNVFLREIMKRLNEEEREVVSLHVISGLKHREIAKLLQKPLSAVLSKYNRAIKKLQAIAKEVN